jgi:hypothetical protein
LKRSDSLFKRSRVRGPVSPGSQLTHSSAPARFSNERPNGFPRLCSDFDPKFRSNQRCCFFKFLPALLCLVLATAHVTPASASFAQGGEAGQWSTPNHISRAGSHPLLAMQSGQSPSLNLVVSSQQPMSLSPFLTAAGNVGAFLSNPYPASGTLNDVQNVFTEIDTSTGDFLSAQPKDIDEFATAGCAPSDAARRRSLQPCPSANYTVLSRTVAPGSCIALYACRAAQSTNITRRSVLVAILNDGTTLWDFWPSDAGSRFANDSEADFVFSMESSGSAVSVCA